MDRHTSFAPTTSATTAMPASTSVLGAYLYDTSSIQDRLLQTRSETPAERIARLERLINATASILPVDTSKKSTPRL